MAHEQKPPDARSAYVRGFLLSTRRDAASFCRVASFTVPYTDHQIEIDPDRGLVMLYLNAWNRQSCGTPDKTYPFDALRADKALMALLTGMLAHDDAAELERLVRA